MSAHSDILEIMNGDIFKQKLTLAERAEILCEIDEALEWCIYQDDNGTFLIDKAIKAIINH